MNKYQEASTDLQLYFGSLLHGECPNETLEEMLGKVELLDELIEEKSPVQPLMNGSISKCGKCNELISHTIGTSIIDKIKFCKSCGYKIEWSKE